MSCAVRRCERGATIVRYDLRIVVAKILMRLARQATRYLFAGPHHVDLATGGHVPLRRDGLTEHGFLPEDAWKEPRFVSACRAALER
jgi:hypothetical protein